MYIVSLEDPPLQGRMYLHYGLDMYVQFHMEYEILGSHCTFILKYLDIPDILSLTESSAHIMWIP